MLTRLFINTRTAFISINYIGKTFSSHRIFHKQLLISKSLKSIRLFSTKNADERIKETIPSATDSSEKEEFITIYTNPGVKYMALINRAVYIPTVCTVAAYPIASILYLTDLINFKNYWTSLLIGTYLCCVLHSLVFNIWRKIGFLYVNRDLTKLKIGYVTYWGRREDVILPVAKIMTFSDIRSSPLDTIYRKVKTFDAGFFGVYKLDPYIGNIVNPELFQQVFGSTKVAPEIFDKLKKQN